MRRAGPRTEAAARIAAVLLVGILIQTTILPDLRIHDVAPDLMLVIAVCAGVAGGTELGATVGFAAGFLTDLFLQTTPVGLAALAYCLAGCGVGWLRGNVFHQRSVVTPLLAAAGAAFGVLLFVVIGGIMGQSQLTSAGKGWIVEVMVTEAIWAVLLGIPVSMVMGVAAAGTSAVNSIRASLEGSVAEQTVRAQRKRERSGGRGPLRASR